MLSANQLCCLLLNEYSMEVYPLASWSFPFGVSFTGKLSNSSILLWNSEKPNGIGPLHDPVTWYRINHTGTQVTQWDFQNKGTRTSPARLSFVLEVPLRNVTGSCKGPKESQISAPRCATALFFVALYELFIRLASLPSLMFCSCLSWAQAVSPFFLQTSFSLQHTKPRDLSLTPSEWQMTFYQEQILEWHGVRWGHFWWFLIGCRQ